MFGFGRGRFPFILPLVVLAAFVGFALAGPVGSALGFASFLLLLPLKLLVFMFLFGAFFRFARGGAPWGGRGGRGRGGPWAPPREPTREERERAEAHRRAKEEVDTLFPDL